HRIIYLTDRCIEALKQLPVSLHSEYVFVNPATGKPYCDIRKPWRRACTKAGVVCGVDGGIIVHDLRRTAITELRRSGTPESVVMKMSGHKTRAVFDRYNIVEEDDVREAVQRLQDHRLGRDLVEVEETAPQIGRGPVR
ncbi:MAG: tyrosine-type recombinase/integrase, partial [Deltaproteobacteria bacterium]|nr:tyrosine-type recombinase/integrase [Deltaproteobacteria bacterium]